MCYKSLVENWFTDCIFEYQLKNLSTNNTKCNHSYLSISSRIHLKNLFYLTRKQSVGVPLYMPKYVNSSDVRLMSAAIMRQMLTLYDCKQIKGSVQHCHNTLTFKYGLWRSCVEPSKYRNKKISWRCKNMHQTVKIKHLAQTWVLLSDIVFILKWHLWTSYELKWFMN